MNCLIFLFFLFLLVQPEVRGGGRSRNSSPNPNPFGYQTQNRPSRRLSPQRPVYPAPRPHSYPAIPSPVQYRPPVTNHPQTFHRPQISPFRPPTFYMPARNPQPRPWDNLSPGSYPSRIPPAAIRPLPNRFPVTHRPPSPNRYPSPNRVITSPIVTECSLSLEDFGSPPPVYIKNGLYLTPDGNGRVVMTASEAVIISCPGLRNYVIFDKDDGKRPEQISAFCKVNKIFQVESTEVEFKKIRCKSNPTVEVKKTNQPCNHGTIHSVGFSINGGFYSSYEACFNEQEIRTYYVEYKLTPGSKYTQKVFNSAGKKKLRPNFKQHGRFASRPLDELYNFSNQSFSLYSILGELPVNFAENKEFLTKGHLAPMADFVMYTQARATFQYINVAPQWSSCNNRDWNVLEDNLRSHIHQLGIDVTVFTGTHDIMVLPDVNRVMKELYLDFDRNGHGRLPIPLYFYKVVYNPVAHTAAAFVSINSPFYNNTILASLTFCTNICKRFPWLNWQATKHSFCCEYDDFVQKIHNLPITVTGIFY